MRVTLEMVDGLLPVGGEDVLVLPVKALVDVGPRACVELCGRISLLGELERVLLAAVGSKWWSQDEETYRCAGTCCCGVSTVRRRSHELIRNMQDSLP